MKLLARLALPLLALAVMLAGCMPSKFATDPQEATAKGWLEQLRQRHFDAIEAAADPAIQSDSLRATLVRMADAIPSGEPSSVVLVGDQHLSTPDGDTVNLSYEYDYGGHYVLANVAIRTRGGASKIVGMTVYPVSKPLEEQHRFALGGHAAIAYGVLAGAILSPLVILFALVTCIRTPLKGRKWPWIVFILFGFCTISVNWATDAWSLQLVSVNLFGAAAISASRFSPWIIGFAFPVGAILFLAWRHKLKAGAPAEAAGIEAAPEATA